MFFLFFAFFFRICFSQFQFWHIFQFSCAYSSFFLFFCFWKIKTIFFFVKLYLTIVVVTKCSIKIFMSNVFFYRNMISFLFVVASFFKKFSTKFVIIVFVVKYWLFILLSNIFFVNRFILSLTNFCEYNVIVFEIDNCSNILFFLF